MRSRPDPKVVDLAVIGTLPPALTGRFLFLGPSGVVHALWIRSGQLPSFGKRPLPEGVLADRLLAFGPSVLAFAEGDEALELGPGSDTFRRVDLAGAHRGLLGRPNIDLATKELHLLTAPSDEPQVHVTVSRGALNRRTRPVDDPPNVVRALVPGRDHIVLLADGHVGVTGRGGPDRSTRWFSVDTDRHEMACAHSHGVSVSVHATGSSLVRWTFEPRSHTVRTEVLDPAPQSFATSNPPSSGGPPQFLWTVGPGIAHKHDLVAETRRSHRFRRGRSPGELRFVADPQRRGAGDGGWLVGLVHGETGSTTEFVVLDAEAVERAPVAVVPLPDPLPAVPGAVWIPLAQI